MTTMACRSDPSDQATLCTVFPARDLWGYVTGPAICIVASPVTGAGSHRDADRTTAGCNRAEEEPGGGSQLELSIRTGRVPRRWRMSAAPVDPGCRETTRPAATACPGSQASRRTAEPPGDLSQSERNEVKRER